MQPTITSKLPDVGTTIFTVMSELAADCGAINLAQGFPSFDPPDALTDRIHWHLKHGGNQYAPMAGIAGLRDAIAAKTARLQNRHVDATTEVTICTGATEGLFSTIQAMVKPGDEVIVFDPAYDSYEPSVTLAGGITIHVPLSIAANGADFGIDWQRFEDAVNHKTRLVIINFPHNPTGAILSAADLDRLADVIRDSRAYILSDEVYEHIVFDGETHRSLARHDELWQRSFVVCSFGKTFHATGWKIGYCLAPADLTAEFRKVHQFTTFAVSTPMQLGLADYLQSDAGFCEQLSAFYQQKRDHFCGQLEDTRFRFEPSRSTFFQIVDYGEISDESDVDLAKRWTREIGVASIPLSVFCEQAFTGTRLRFCFAKDDATLTEAVKRFAAL
ncbi:MAG: methionine aminotransferase [Gammaproteobacteria bacterium]|nr:methionine aminotransferase [Gammaproteobacteria bacterium]MDH3372977.1 methionine aminotransferase [Gammaproteobacteria bacterium]MDH3552252.1 methionine aminotransferase [Gammaproteobacteria bacterium]